MWARIKAAWWAFKALFRVKRALDAPPPPIVTGNAPEDFHGSG
jgi:hypothetical protein